MCASKRTIAPILGWVIASVDVWALAPSVAAALAVFRLKVGMIPTLAACCAAGIALYLARAIG